MSVWDDPELRAGGEFVKLEAVGDKVEGQVLAVRSHKFDDGSTAPQIIYQDASSGEERTWTAGQIQAKRRLAELRPEAGDWIKAVLVQIEKRSGGKTLKHIEIEVRHAGQGAAPATSAPAAPAAPAAQVAAPAQAAPAATATIPACPAGVDPIAWGAMTPERRDAVLAALGAPAANANEAAAGFQSNTPPF